MNIWIGLGAATVGYLFGAISFTRIVGRRVLPGEDLSYGEFPMGETTLRVNRTSSSLISMKKGPAFGCLTSLLDMAKAAIPVLVFKLVFPDQHYEFLAAATAVVGHNYPVYYRFHGGGGMCRTWAGWRCSTGCRPGALGSRHPDGGFVAQRHAGLRCRCDLADSVVRVA